jgi:hypothetical protein
MNRSTRELFNQISGLLERARLEKDKPALEKAIGFLDQAKGSLHSLLTDIIAGAKRNATIYLKTTPDAAPNAGQFADRTQKVLAQQVARVATIPIRKETSKMIRSRATMDRMIAAGVHTPYFANLFAGMPACAQIHPS